MEDTIILRIANDSNVIKNFFEETLTEENLTQVKDFLTNVPFNMELVIKVYNNDYSFNNNEYLTLASNLNYLESGKLDEILITIKYLNVDISSLSEDLIRKINEIDIENHLTLYNSLLFYGKIDMLKWIDNSNKQFNFNKACILGHIDIAKWYLSENSNISIKEINFIDIAKTDNLEILKWFLTFGSDNKLEKIRITFKYACENGSIRIVKYLYTLYKTNLNFSFNYNFYKPIIMGNHLNILEYLFNYFTIQYDVIIDILKLAVLNNLTGIIQFFYNKIPQLNNDILSELINIACSNNHIIIVKYLYYYYNYKSTDNEALINTCAQRGPTRNNNLDLFEWLISIGYNPLTQKDFLFTNACKYGHINIAKRILSIVQSNNEDIDIHDDDDGPFKFACENGFEDVVLWLIELYRDEIDYEAEDNYAFIQAIINDHLNIVQILVDTFDIDIHENEEEAIIMACENDCTEILLYLISLEETHGKFDLNIKDGILFKNDYSHEIKNILMDLYTKYEISNMDFS
jgi:hypothetical protein